MAPTLAPDIVPPIVFPTMIPEVSDDPDNANVEVHPPQLDIPFSDAKVEVASQVEIPFVNANSEVPPPDINLSIYHREQFTTKRKFQSRDVLLV